MANPRDFNLQIRQELEKITEKIYRLPDSNSLGIRDAISYYRLQKTLEQNGHENIVQEVKKEVMSRYRKDGTFTHKLALTNRDNLVTACDKLRTLEDQLKNRIPATAPPITRKLPPADTDGMFLTPPAAKRMHRVPAQNDTRISALAAAVAASAKADSPDVGLPVQTSATPPDLKQIQTVSLTGTTLFQPAANNTDNDDYGTGCSCALM